MAGLMVCLGGEQVIPNLLAIRYSQVDKALFAVTDLSCSRVERLRPLLKAEIETVPVPPFDMPAARGLIRRSLAAEERHPSQVVFNLTGGTKPMALAAYSLAQEMGSPLLYLHESMAYRYEFHGGREVALSGPHPLPTLVSIDDYLRACVGQYRLSTRRADRLEQAVDDSLRPVLDETKLRVWIGANVEIDLVMRFGNRIGVAEVKSTPDKSAIDQLVSAANPTQLGTYARRFLIGKQALVGNNVELARAYGITAVSLSSRGDTLDEKDEALLRSTILRELGGSDGSN